MHSLERLAKELGARVGLVDARRLRPMPLVRGKVPLDAHGWGFQLKIDGARLIAGVSAADEVMLTYRTGRSCAPAYPELVAAVRALGPIVVDGEVYAVDERGRPSFEHLQRRIFTSTPRNVLLTEVPARLAVFDVLQVGPYDVRALPLTARSEILTRAASLVGGDPRLMLMPVAADGIELARACLEYDLEGVVAKRLDSPYSSSRGAWVKMKNEREDAFVVTGCAREGGRLVGLTVASYEDKALRPRGVVELGLHAHRELLANARPGMVVNVRYLTWTSRGFLRQAMLRGVRHDVPARACKASPSRGG